MTEIAAVHPIEQFYENGVLREEPPYQPPRWKCDQCGVEVQIPDHGFHARYKDEAERPTNPAGWIFVGMVPEAINQMNKALGHFCSVDCLATYRGWLDAHDG